MHDAGPPVTNNSKTDTDLPLLPGGNNGNGGRAPGGAAGTAVSRLLLDVFEPLPEPRFELLDAGEVRKWIDSATAHLLFRRDRQNLLREAMRVLEEEWRTAMRSDGLRAQAARQQERLLAKQARGYWRDRDARRRATRPAHVVVDPAAWERAKAASVERRSSVGIVVGELVSREVRTPQRRGSLPSPKATDRRLFVRIAVQPETWAASRALASRAGVPVERFLGLLVVEHFDADGR